MQQFSQEFRSDLMELMKWRRDVRHFKPDPVDPDHLSACLNAFRLAPSVGLSESWRIVNVKSPAARSKVLDNYQSANVEALQGYDGDKVRLYANLKLSGLQGAPEQLAIFCDEITPKGSGLGTQTMPETWRLVAYLCIGLPENDSLTPELESAGWEERDPALAHWIEV